jgi:hypothetical protein
MCAWPGSGRKSRAATRRVGLVVVTLTTVLLPVAAHAGNDSRSPQPAPEGLPRAGDLPPGWEVDFTSSRTTYTRSRARQETRDCGPGNLTGLQSIIAASLRPGTTVASAGYTLPRAEAPAAGAGVTLWRYPDAEAASRVLQRERSFLDRCGSVTFPEYTQDGSPGAPITFRRELAVPPPRVDGAEDSIGVSVEQQHSTQTVVTNVLEFRVGSVLAYVSGRGTSTEWPSDRIVREFARLSIERLQREGA